MEFQHIPDYFYSLTQHNLVRSLISSVRKMASLKPKIFILYGPAGCGKSLLTWYVHLYITKKFGPGKCFNFGRHYGGSTSSSVVVNMRVIDNLHLDYLALLVKNGNSIIIHANDEDLEYLGSLPNELVEYVPLTNSFLGLNRIPRIQNPVTELFS